METKIYHLYLLDDVKTFKPIYVGLTRDLRNRIYKHEKTKNFDGVLILESFSDKKEGLAAERCLIKFFSHFEFESIVNGLYVNIACQMYKTNLIKQIKNGRLG